MKEDTVIFPYFLMVILICILISYVYYILIVVEEPTVVFSEENDFCKLIVSKISALNESFYPNPLMMNGHLATMLPTILRHAPTFKFTRETLETPDGGEVSLDWFYDNAIEKTNSRAIIVILHGLTGGSHERFFLLLFYVMFIPISFLTKIVMFVNLFPNQKNLVIYVLCSISEVHLEHL
jgi:hypothetical protein